MARSRADLRAPLAAVEAALSIPAQLARAEEPEQKGRLRAQTEDAMRRGVFGAPSFFVGDELFFGQDRMVEAIELAAIV